MTAQDYGIDFEIELVEDGRVCGHCVKVQVKSSENLYKDKDERPSIGGIKQTTLRYWAEPFIQHTSNSPLCGFENRNNLFNWGNLLAGSFIA